LMLMRLRKWGHAKRFYTSVPRFYQLAVPTIFAALASLAFAFFNTIFLAISAFLLFTFYFLLSPWLAYLAREHGLRFALIAALFQPIDAIVVGWGMLKAVMEFVRGRRY